MPAGERLTCDTGYFVVEEILGYTNQEREIEKKQEVAENVTGHTFKVQSIHK